MYLVLKIFFLPSISQKNIGYITDSLNRKTYNYMFAIL